MLIQTNIDISSFCTTRVNTTKGDIVLFGRTDLAESDVPLRQYCICRGGNFNQVEVICNLTTATATCIDGTTSPGSFGASCGSGRSKRSISMRYRRSVDSQTNNGAIDKIPLVYSDDFQTEPEVNILQTKTKQPIYINNKY